MNYNQTNHSLLFKESNLYGFHTYSSDEINTDMIPLKEKQLTSADLYSPVFVHKSLVANESDEQCALYQDQQNGVDPLLQPKKSFICDLSRSYDDYKNDFSSLVPANNHSPLHYYDSQMNSKVLLNGSGTDYRNDDMYRKKEQQQQQYRCNINSRSSSNHFNTELPPVTTSMNQLNTNMNDTRTTTQTTDISQRNINKQLLASHHMDKQSHREHVYTSADLNDITTITTPSTTRDYTQHQFSCSTQGTNYKAENITSNPQWSHIVAENRPNKDNVNHNKSTLFTSNKYAVQRPQNKKNSISTSCATLFGATVTTSLFEHQPTMYKPVNEHNSDKDSNVRPIRRHSSPYIKYNSCGNVNDPSSYNNNSNNGIKCLSDSLAFQSGLVGSDTSASSKRLAVAKITNMPWQVETKEVEQFFSHSLKDGNYQYVHLLINKSTGKTQKEAFVEFDSEKDFAVAMKTLKSGLMFKGRKVNITKSSSEELFRSVFPNWKGEFINGVPSISIDNNDDHCGSHSVEKSKERYSQSSNTSTLPSPPPSLIERYEYDSLLNICRNYKSSYSRKCPSRPFENFISIMVKFPWHAPQIITTMQRDHLYEYYKLATGSLRYHLDKPYPKLSNSLIVHMVRVALVCPGLTINQKKGILTASKIPCPNELTHFLIELSKGDDSSLEEGKKSVA